MTHVLALQALESSNGDVVTLASNTSGTCSDASGAGGRSGCSIACGVAEEMDW